MLAHFRLPVDEIVSSILRLDENVCSQNNVNQLLKNAPTPDEVPPIMPKSYNNNNNRLLFLQELAIRSYDGTLEDMGVIEQWLYKLQAVPRFTSRLQTFSFKQNFESQLADVKHVSIEIIQILCASNTILFNTIKTKNLQVVYSACRELMLSQSFIDMLEVCTLPPYYYMRNVLRLP